MDTDTIDTIIAGITAAESGTYTDDPDDNGGPTKWGITLATLQDLQPGATADDVAALTIDQADAIYRQRYVNAPHFDAIIAIDPALAFEVVTWGVMSGPSVPAKALQRICNVMNQRGAAYSEITADGQFGPASQLALRQLYIKRGAMPHGASTIRLAFQSLFGAFLIMLAEGNAKDEDYIFGWLDKRVNV
jgi:lysozyme family protein